MDVNYAMGQRPGNWSPDISPLLKQKNHGDHCCKNHHDRFSRLTGTFPPGIYLSVQVCKQLFSVVLTDLPPNFHKNEFSKFPDFYVSGK
jgi:hypothetical protein